MWRFVKRTLLISAVASIGLLSVSMLAARALGVQTLSVQSGSMAPHIDRGDLVAVKSVPYKDLQVGDVITYISPENRQATITHRITAIPIEGVKFITRGDANTAPDAVVVDKTAIVGRVENIVPYAGHMADFVHSWPGLIALVYVPALWVMVVEIKRLAVYFREQQGIYYVLAGYDPFHGNAPVKNRSMVGAKVGAIVGLAIVFSVVPITYAALQSQATLTSNSIQTIDLSEPEEPTAPGEGCTITNTGPNSTNTCTNQNTTNCTVTNNNNTTVTNTNNQTAGSGDATNTNNTSDDEENSASSGDASNSSTTSTTVVTSSDTTCPSPPQNP